MSIKLIKKLNSDEMFKLLQIYYYEYLNKKIKEFDDENYPIKSYDDKFVCKICNGTYLRYSRSRHEKSKKHHNKFMELKENFANIFLI